MVKKMKVKKSVSRRFRLTRKGKILHRASFGRHLRRNKSKSQIRGFKKAKTIKGKTAKKIKKLLGK